MTARSSSGHAVAATVAKFGTKRRPSFRPRPRGHWYNLSACSMRGQGGSPTEQEYGVLRQGKRITGCTKKPTAGSRPALAPGSRGPSRLACTCRRYRPSSSSPVSAAQPPAVGPERTGAARAGEPQPWNGTRPLASTACRQRALIPRNGSAESSRYSSTATRSMSVSRRTVKVHLHVVIKSPQNGHNCRLQDGAWSCPTATPQVRHCLPSRCAF